MKNEVLSSTINGANREVMMLNILRSLEKKIEKELGSKDDFIGWQQDELKRLRQELLVKEDTIQILNQKLNECRSHVEGNRQLINKLITDVDKLQHNIDWYRRTYETRSLFGVIKDKFKHFFK